MDRYIRKPSSSHTRTEYSRRLDRILELESDIRHHDWDISVLKDRKRTTDIYLKELRAELAQETQRIMEAEEKEVE